MLKCALYVGVPNMQLHYVFHIMPYFHTLYTSRKPLRHLLATWVPSCEEPGSAHEQTCKISREKMPHPLKQRRDELRKRNFFVSLPLWRRLLISADSSAEWGWPDIGLADIPYIDRDISHFRYIGPLYGWPTSRILTWYIAPLNISASPSQILSEICRVSTFRL